MGYEVWGTASNRYEGFCNKKQLIQGRQLRAESESQKVEALPNFSLILQIATGLFQDGTLGGLGSLEIISNDTTLTYRGSWKDGLPDGFVTCTDSTKGTKIVGLWQGWV